MPREDDKIPVKDDKQVIHLRQGNDKTRPCPHCKEVFNSKQALWAHLHTSTSPCVQLERAAAETPPPVQRNEITPVTLNLDSVTMGEKDTNPPPPPPVAVAATTEDEEEPSLDGDTPPIPMFLVFVVIALLVLVGVVVIFWDSLYKLYKKYLGGDQPAGTPEQSPAQ